MNDSLKAETLKLERTWASRDATHLNAYLVSGVEDPRLNLQSIFSRHFLLRELGGSAWADLMREECRFAGTMNWLVKLARAERDREAMDSVLHALNCGSDNAEGIMIPHAVLRTFQALPLSASGLQVPNYVAQFLQQADFTGSKLVEPSAVLNTFVELWRGLLHQSPPGVPHKPAVIEPACGSANDFRFLHAYGIAERIDYTGFDLCRTNVENACALFPGVRFTLGNVFEIAAADRSFDLCFFHDLLEHLSLAGMERALDEICRVTNRGICAGFFNMDEIPDHIERPYEEYHWNTLSMGPMKDGFARRGFSCRVLHVGSFLAREFGCDDTHNPNAYTFIAWRP